MDITENFAGGTDYLNAEYMAYRKILGSFDVVDEGYGDVFSGMEQHNTQLRYARDGRFTVHMTDARNIDASTGCVDMVLCFDHPDYGQYLIAETEVRYDGIAEYRRKMFRELAQCIGIIENM